MNPKSTRPAGEKNNSRSSRKSWLWLALLVGGGVLVWWLLPTKETPRTANPGQTVIAPIQAFAVKQGRLHNFGKSAQALPLNAESAITNVLHMFDSNRASGTARFLVGGLVQNLVEIRSGS